MGIHDRHRNPRPGDANMINDHWTRAREGIAPRMIACFLLTFCAITGCSWTDKVLQVEAPGQVVADSLAGPSNAALLVQSTVADFECALGAYILAGGLMGDEFADATPNAPNWPVD